MACSRSGCENPSTWTFEADGPLGAFEIVGGLLIEPGDTIRLCDEHVAELRAECEGRDDVRFDRG